MTADNLRMHFHLTTKGWVDGKSKFTGEVENGEMDRPEIAIATFELHIYQKSEWSPENSSWSEIWQREDMTQRKIIAFIKKFPRHNVGIQELIVAAKSWKL